MLFAMLGFNVRVELTLVLSHVFFLMFGMMLGCKSRWVCHKTPKMERMVRMVMVMPMMVVVVPTLIHVVMAATRWLIFSLTTG